MIKIRSLQKSDEKQLSDLTIQFHKKYQRGKIVLRKLLPLIEYKDYEKRLQQDVKKYMKLDPREAIIFVAEDEKELIGYIYGRLEKRSKMVINKCGIIEDWFVKEKYRGKGIGEMLWDKLIRWFKNKKCNCLKTDAYLTNKLAINIYHKLGFIDEKIVMWKRL